VGAKDNIVKVAKMTLGHNDKRTSAQQLMWVWNKISGFFKGLFSHIRRCRGPYSFLSGALSTLFFLWAFIWYGVLAYPVPWKVIDPTDPRFDPLAFRFSDYDSGFQSGQVYACLFPKGTDKSYVDRILVDIGNAITQKNMVKNKDYYHPNEYKYTYSTPRSKFGHAMYTLVAEEKSIFIRFDALNKVEDAVFLKHSQCNKESEHEQ